MAEPEIQIDAAVAADVVPSKTPQSSEAVEAAEVTPKSATAATETAAATTTTTETIVLTADSKNDDDDDDDDENLASKENFVNYGTYPVVSYRSSFCIVLFRLVY